MAVTPAEERILRRIRNAHRRRELIRLRDGRYYFLPIMSEDEFDQSNGLSSAMLRALADELDKLNTSITSAGEKEFRNGTA